MLFDFDETLVNLDDFVDWKKAKQAVIQSYISSGIPTEIVKKYQSSMMMISKLYDYLLRSYPSRISTRIQNHASRALENYELEAAAKATLMPGAKDILVWSKRRKLGTGVVSSNSALAIRAAASRLSITRYLDEIVGRHFPLKMKPNPDQLMHCLHKLRCTPIHAIAVGDRTYDVIAAKEVGMFSVAVASGKSSKEELMESGADRVIGSLYELKPIVELLF